MSDTATPTFTPEQNQALIDKKLGLGEYVPNPAAPYNEESLKKLSKSELKRLEATSPGPRICIQAGHVNIQYNSIVALRGGTGAPGEAQFNQIIRDLLSTALRARGFTVQGTDANANDDPNITTVDWDMCLAIHYDADVYGVGGGGVFAPAADDDYSNAKSLAEKAAILGKYFGVTGVADHQERENGNTLYYYLWSSLTANTPCVLIECGVGEHKPDDYDLLQNAAGQAKVVEGIARGICAYFNMPYDITPPTPPTPPSPATILAEVKTIANATTDVNARMNQIKALVNS